MYKNANNETVYTVDECIAALQKLIDSDGVMQKRAVDLHALEMATRALEEEGGNPHIIATMSYHAARDMAYIYPDGITKAVLTAGRDALMRKQRGW